jgi:hypothetical protein
MLRVEADIPLDRPLLFTLGIEATGVCAERIGFGLGVTWQEGVPS